MLPWPVCMLVAMVTASAEHCPENPPVDNSIVVVKKEEGHLEETFLCVDGYYLVGEKTLFCNASGVWSAPTPICHVGHCPDPMLENGECSHLGPVSMGDAVTCQCAEGHILKGSRWGQCQKNHTWVPALPTCRSVNCDPPMNLAHGYFEGEDFNLGSTVVYHCEERYRLVGAQVLWCVDGEWSGETPVCELTPQGAILVKIEKALLAFQENEEMCKALENFMQRLKEHGFIMEKVKYFLEMRKTELEAQLWT